MISKTKDLKTQRPLVLSAKSYNDLEIISSLVQDSILRKENIKWQKKRHRFSLFLYRFRWELLSNKKPESHHFRRTQTILIFDSVLGVSSRGLKNALLENVLSLLKIDLNSYRDFEEIILIFSGNIVIKLRAEFLDLRLKDLQSSSKVVISRLPNHEI